MPGGASASGSAVGGGPSLGVGLRGRLARELVEVRAALGELGLDHVGGLADLGVVLRLRLRRLLGAVLSERLAAALLGLALCP